MPKLAHKLVAKVAKEMAGVLYDQLMRNDVNFVEWKACNPEADAKALEARFITLAYPQLLEQSRVTLAKLLTTPMDDYSKETIADALIQDNLLRIGRQKSTGFRGADMLFHDPSSYRH